MIIFKNILILVLLSLCLFLSYMLFQDNENASKQTFEDFGLATLAQKHNLYIGSAVNSTYLLEDAKYQQLLSKEVNMITTENEMKFDIIHPEPSQYNFSKADQIVSFGIKNNMKVRGHTLVWHHRIPPWLEQGDYTKDEMKEILKKHIQTIVKRYKGKVYAWDVVNEAYNEDGSLKDSIWLRTIGPEYIALSFQWAHDADPNALLFYNDFNIEGMNPKSDAVYGMIKYFKRKNIPISGLGYQLHTKISNSLNEWKIKENLDRVSKLNMEIQLTEVDITVGDGNEKLGSLNSMFDKQADMYSKVLKTCLETNSCTAFIMWGISDKYTARKENKYPLIFDANYQPKKAYWSLVEMLE
jgi:endo-1,4-beta-xylanase